jgi:hypothetical protein
MGPQEVLPKKTGTMKMKNPISAELISRYIDSLNTEDELFAVSSQLIGITKYAKNKWLEKHNINIQAINEQHKKLQEQEHAIAEEEAAILAEDDGKVGKVKSVMPEMGEHLMENLSMDPVRLPDVDNFSAPTDFINDSSSVAFAPKPLLQMKQAPQIQQPQQTGVTCPDVPGCNVGGRNCGYYPPGSQRCNDYRKKRFHL